jgi:hypothetical protein
MRKMVFLSFMLIAASVLPPALAQTTTPAPALKPMAALTAVAAPASIYGARLFMHDIPASPDLIASQPNGWQQAISDPNNCGAQIVIPWAVVDNGTTYNWSPVDNYIALWAGHGKYVSITFGSAAARVGQDMVPSGSAAPLSNTPSYVLKSGLPVIQCHQELGEPGYFTPPTPDYLDGRYLTPWKKFIAAAIARYGNDSRLPI